MEDPIDVNSTSHAASTMSLPLWLFDEVATDKTMLNGWVAAGIAPG
jgi:hypothetical protein